MDILSDVLRNVRLSGALLFFAEYHAPWCIMCPPSQEIAPMLVPGARQLVIFHIIIDGRCFVGRPDEEPVELASGDASSEERRVGKGGVRKCKFRGSADH